MVKKSFFISLSAFLLILTSLFAGEFTASVNQTQVNLGESFSLNLTLKNASAKEAPAVSALKKDFIIHSQQQSMNTTIINGSVTSSVTWKLSLTPKTEGSVQIPPITVDTVNETLSTLPITLIVMKGSQQSSKDCTGPNISTKVSNESPYKNEPIVYTATLTSKTQLYNVQTEKMKVEDAIVELIKEPKLEERVIGGVLLNVIEFTYLITPLKAGPIKIPPMAIEGAIPQKRRERFDPFDDDIGPFGFMQGFERVKPFTLVSEEIQLDVQPAVSEVSPWLPAQALTLEEQWPSDQSLRAGEPFSRTFVIKAQGPKASQLPHLEDLQSQSSNFKVYSDKPEEQETVFQSVVHSTRKEQYTLIPQQAGTWILPEMSVSWWDSAKKEKRVSTIPARTVQILPSLTTAASNPSEIPSTPIVNKAANDPIPTVQSPILLYSIIGILTCLLIAALIWIMSLQRKIASLTKEPSTRPIKHYVKKDKKEKLPDLNPT